MNNEFNNQDMNEFQNGNNFNNSYVNNSNNKNDKWKDTVIAILVIIVFILTSLSLYFVVTMKDNNLDGKDNNIQENESDEDENTINKEINLKNIECSGDENTCTKIFNVNYNDMQHEIKIIQSITSKNDGSPFVCFKEIQIFVDNKMIEKIENISSHTADNNFDGYAYIFDSKYLGILYPSNQGDYVLNVYNNNTKIGEQKIIWGIQGIYKDKEFKEQLNTLEKIEFDEHKLLFWGDSCYVPVNVGDRFIKTSLTIKNNKIDMEAVDFVDKLYGSGATC